METSRRLGRAIMAEKDLYSVLGVKRDASPAEIRRVFRRRARQYHPDVNPGNAQAAERFKGISAANDILNDEKKRRQEKLYVRRFRAKARLAGQVQSRIKMLARREKMEKLQSLETLEFAFNAAPFEAKRMGEVHDLAFSYDRRARPDAGIDVFRINEL